MRAGRSRCYNFDGTCLALAPTGTHGWWWTGRSSKPQFQRPTKQAVTVTVVTSPVEAKVRAQVIFHGTTQRVVPDVATDVWMSCSHNHWASTDTSRQLFNGMEEAVNAAAGTPKKAFAVMMDMASVHTSAETMEMLKTEFDWVKPIFVPPPHTTSFLQPCDVGLMRPFKKKVRETACTNYALALFNNTDEVGKASHFSTTRTRWAKLRPLSWQICA